MTTTNVCLLILYSTQYW